MMVAAWASSVALCMVSWRTRIVVVGFAAPYLIDVVSVLSILKLLPKSWKGGVVRLMVHRPFQTQLPKLERVSQLEKVEMEMKSKRKIQWESQQQCSTR